MKCVPGKTGRNNLNDTRGLRHCRQGSANGLGSTPYNSWSWRRTISRNPISGILAAGQYLLEDAGAVLDEQHLAMLQSIDSSSRTMLRLIDDLIELANLESGELRLEIRATEIHGLMDQAVAASQAVADRKRVRLVTEPHGNAALPVCPSTR